MKQDVDLLLTNAIVLTMDEEYHLFEPGAVAVQGDSILEVGPQSLLIEKYTTQKTVDCRGKVLMPGLVNAHTHVPMTLLRSLSDDLRLDVWLLGYMLPVEREFVNPEFVRLGTQIACAEMIRSGVTCFADMYYFEDHIAQATADAGLRALCAETIMKFPTPDARFYEESLAATREYIQRWKGHPLIVPAVGPHSPYMCTEEILHATADLALEFDVPIHIHIAETALEVENARNEHGMPVVPYTKKHNIFNAKVLTAHCVHIDEGEMYTLRNHKAGVAHNPSSNLKLASGIAPITKMIELGLNVGIGTDGTASNNDLDMFEEVRLAALLAKTASGDPTSIPARTALTMATRMGAKALHLGNITGTLEAGKRADLILVDIKQLHNSPRFLRDPQGIYAQVVYASKSTDVTDVMVNGKWLMQEHQLTTLQEDELIRQTESYARRIDQFLVQREKSILSKLIAIGSASEGESFEVQNKVRIPDPSIILEAMQSPAIEILRKRHYHQFDTYFLFADPAQGSIRYREDEFKDEKEQTNNVRYRLTLIGPAREHQYPSDVLLSRSRYLAPASHSLRFYREYFKPTDELFIEKDRQRWRILFHGTEFYVNLDCVMKPDLGYFLEIKSRTWSSRDAEHKAQVMIDLLNFLAGPNEETVTKDYLELVQNS